MRAVHWNGETIEVDDVDEPSGDGVVVEVRSAGICGSDLHMIGGPRLRYTLGHEIGGVLADGTPVAVWPSRPCGECDRCRAGHVAQCRTGPFRLHGIGADGGMADRVLVQSASIVAVPAGVRAEDAALVEPIACSVHALRRARLDGSESVAVVGAGTIGLGAAAVARWLGCPVAVAARHPAQRDAAVRIGASLDPTDEHDVVVDAAGTSGSLAAALALVRPGGTIVMVATHWEPIEMPAFFTMKEPVIVSAMTHGDSDEGHDMELAARVVGDMPELAPAVITHRIPLARAADAFRLAADRASGAIKVVLEP